MITEEHRVAFEGTDEVIQEMRMLMVLADAAEDTSPEEGEYARELRNAISLARATVLGRFKELEKARTREWVSLGGKSIAQEPIGYAAD